MRGPDLNLRAKVSLGVLLPLIVVLGGLAVIQYRRHQNVMLEQLSLLAANSALVIQTNLRHEMEEVDPEGMQLLFDTLSSSDRFSVAYLVNPEGRVVLSADGEPTGAMLDSSGPDCVPCHALEPDSRPVSIVVTAANGERVFRSMLPIENGPSCVRCHEPGTSPLAAVLIDIPTAPLERQLAAGLRKDLLWLAATVLATVLIANAVVSRFVIDRLVRMSRAVGQFGKGDRSLRLAPDGNDEVGRLAQVFNEMCEDISLEEQRSAELSAEVQTRAAAQRHLLGRVISAQEEERRRVAQDLHDDLGQDLAALAVNLEAVRQRLPDASEEVVEKLAQIRGQVADTTDHAYELILRLRPSALDDLGLVPALRAHAERALAEENIRFDLEADELTERLPPEIETAVFRVLQEALTNVIRHARASRVRMVLAVRDGVLEALVEDDGRGFDPEKIAAAGPDRQRLGLIGMQERAALCSGSLEIDSRPGAGTRISMRIPLEGLG